MRRFLNDLDRPFHLIEGNNAILLGLLNVVREHSGPGRSRGRTLQHLGQPKSEENIVDENKRYWIGADEVLSDQKCLSKTPAPYCDRPAQVLALCGKR